MAAFYEGTNGPNWTRQDGWSSTAALGTWEGVSTDDEGRVVELNLVGYGLSGELPPELGNLSNLKRLHLGINQLSGCMPAALEDQLDQRESDLGGLPFC